MSAATATSVDAIIKEQIFKFIQQANTKVTSDPGTQHSQFLLQFILDGTHTFETKFTIDLTSYEGQLSNGCISLNLSSYSESFINKNSPSKKCFTPVLELEMLPTGLTPTDVLQTLSTKLKFAIFPERSSLTISDVARVTNPTTKKQFTTKISLWRLLRGEPTLYEKYGYHSSILDSFRERAITVPWKEISGFVTGYGTTLQSIVDEHFPSIFLPDKSIQDCMKEVTLEDTEKYIQKPPPLRFQQSKTIVELIIDALAKKSKDDSFSLDDMNLTITRDSPVWKEWDSRLQFTKVVPVTETTSKDSQGGGGGSRSQTKPKTIKSKPKRYFTGLSARSKKLRQKEIEKFGEMHWKDPRAYIGFQTDKLIKTRTSRYTQKWRQTMKMKSTMKMNQKMKSNSLEAKAEITGVPLSILQECYNRGMAAWRTGHRPGATQQQWGYARVHSFLVCGKTANTTDSDLRQKAISKSQTAKKWFQEQCKLK